MNEVYKKVNQFMEKYTLTIAFRCSKHASVVEKHVNDGEKITYAFAGQKNNRSLLWINSCVIALSNKRLLIGQKRLLWGYFFTSITPDMYNDLKVSKGMLWSNLEIDTIKENVYISNLDPNGAIEIESVITEFMMKEKRKYAKKNN